MHHKKMSDQNPTKMKKGYEKKIKKKTNLQKTLISIS